MVVMLPRMADDVCGWCTYYNLRCELISSTTFFSFKLRRCELISAFGSSGGGASKKPLVLTLLDDDGKVL
jgi:hypothetical protein